MKRLIFNKHFSSFFYNEDRCKHLVERNTYVPSEEELFYQSLARDYLSHMKQQLEHAVQQDDTDWQELQTLGNHLKGSSAMFGYPALSELGAVLERAAQERNGQTTLTILRKLLVHIRTL